jgi:hypothetical protein
MDREENRVRHGSIIPLKLLAGVSDWLKLALIASK